jgi:hypothetical protein
LDVNSDFAGQGKLIDRPNAYSRFGAPRQNLAVGKSTLDVLKHSEELSAAPTLDSSARFRQRPASSNLFTDTTPTEQSKPGKKYKEEAEGAYRINERVAPPAPPVKKIPQETSPDLSSRTGKRLTSRRATSLISDAPHYSDDKRPIQKWPKQADNDPLAKKPMSPQDYPKPVKTTPFWYVNRNKYILKDSDPLGKKELARQESTHRVRAPWVHEDQ